MIFTFGDVVVLLIICALVVTLRQYDRTNRTLNKVKKYADSARAELDRIVQERVDEVRDLSIGLEVHDKRGHALLTRLAEIEELTKRKIDEYQQQLTHLDKKVTRALDTISQLDEYHATSKEKFTYFQKHIHTINEQFIALSRDADELSALQENLPDILRDQRERFRHLIDDKYAMLEKQIKDCAGQTEVQCARAREVHHEYSARLESGIKDGIRAINSAKGKGEERIRYLSRMLTQRQHAERQKIKEQIVLLENEQKLQLAHLKEQYSEKLAEIIADERTKVFNKAENDFGRQLKEFSKREQIEIEKSMSASRAQHLEFKEEANRNAEKLIAEFNENKEALQARHKEALASIHSEYAKRQQSFAELQERFSQLHAESKIELENHDINIKSLISIQHTSFRESEAELQSHLAEKLAALKEEATRAIEATDGELSERVSRIETKSHAINETLRQHEERVNGVIQAGWEQLATEGDAVRSELREQLATLKEEAAHAIEATGATLSEKISSIEATSHDVDSMLQNVQRDVDGQVSAINREMNIVLERARRVQKTAQEQEQRFQSAINGHLDTLSAKTNHRGEEQFQTSLLRMQKTIAEAAKV